jgi:hypothetical protein
VFPKSDDNPALRSQYPSNSLIPCLIRLKLLFPVFAIISGQSSALASMPVASIDKDRYSRLFENKIWTSR